MTTTMRHLLRGACFWHLFTSLVSATFGPLQAALWATPNGSVSGDFQQQWQIGDAVDLTWHEIEPLKYSNLTSRTLDLWVASYNWSTQHYSQLLKKSVDVRASGGGQFRWIVDTPTTEGNDSANSQYMVTFKTPALSYDPNTEGLPSPGFIITRSKGGLSTGAKAGIGATVGVAALALVCVALFVSCRGRKRNPELYEVKSGLGQRPELGYALRDIDRESQTSQSQLLR